MANDRKGLYYFLPYISLILIGVLFILVFMLTDEKRLVAYIKDMAVSRNTELRVSDAETANVKEVVDAYLKENPEVIVNALEEFNRKRAREKHAMVLSFIEKNPEKIIAPHDAKYGAENPKIQIVEFFDYNCGACRQAHATLNKVLEKYSASDIQVVYKELPILGEKSVLLAKAGLAFNMLDSAKFKDMHSKLFRLRKKDKEGLKELAADNGFDVDEFEKRLESKEVMEIIEKNHYLASLLEVRGTPFFIINGKVYPGALSESSFDEVITNELEELKNKMEESGFVNNEGEQPVADLDASNAQS